MTNSRAQCEQASRVFSHSPRDWPRLGAVSGASHGGHALTVLLLQKKRHTEGDVTAFTQLVKKPCSAAVFCQKMLLPFISENVHISFWIQPGSNCDYPLQVIIFFFECLSFPLRNVAEEWLFCLSIPSPRSLSCAQPTLPWKKQDKHSALFVLPFPHLVCRSLDMKEDLFVPASDYLSNVKKI